MKPLRLALCALILVLPGCSVLTPEQKATTIRQLEQAYADGNLTMAQRDAAIEAVRSDGEFDWEGLGVFGLNLVLALVGAPVVVRTMRGPPTQKVGLPASKVKPQA